MVSDVRREVNEDRLRRRREHNRNRKERNQSRKMHKVCFNLCKLESPLEPVCIALIKKNNGHIAIS